MKKMLHVFVLINLIPQSTLYAKAQSDSSATNLIYSEINGNGAYSLNDLENPSSFIYKFFHRLFMIENLGTAISVLRRNRKQLHRCLSTHQDFIGDDDLSKFQHNAIREQAQKIRLLRSLKPLFQSWDNFANYSHLNDHLFVTDFTKLIFVVYKHLLIHLSSKKTMQMEPLSKIAHKPPMQALTSNLHKHKIESVYELIRDINILTEEYASHKQGEWKKFGLNEIVWELPRQVSTKDILMRFYLIKRLNKVVDIVRLLPNIFKISLNVPFQKNGTSALRKVQFKHKIIASCSSEIEQSKKLNSFFSLWRNFTAYRGINDYDFVKEFLVLIYLLCKNIFLNNSSSEDSFSQDDIIEIYHDIAEIPIETILDSIDTFVEKLTEKLERYKIESAKTWSLKLRRYIPWVVIGGIIGGIIVKKIFPDAQAEPTQP